MDYNSHKDMLDALKESQNVEHDNRERAREAHLFVTARDGQWEPFWWNANQGKPRYTFDLTSQIVDQIAGELEQADFDIRVKPGNGKASEETAKIYDGLIRNIETISNAKNVFNEAGRNMVTAGFDCWRVVQRYVEDDSFDQDLMIEPIRNAIDRVWFDQASEERDKSDARFGWVLQSMSPADYEERWPDRSAESVSTDQTGSAYYYQPDVVIVGEFYYVKHENRDLVLMSNGAVYEDDDEFKSIVDELAEYGITETKRRKRPKKCVYRRLFDNAGWLDEPKKTVFQWIPMVPTVANYKVIENKTIYFGAVEKQLDPQRVLNYSLSREIEEGALSPRAKYWMTRKQAAGEEKKLATLNTNSDPVQFFNHDPDYPGVPQQNGGAQINPGLRTISEGMREIMHGTAGLFAPSMGDNPRAQSGVAIERLQNKGDTGMHKYFHAQEVAIAHTGRILVDAIPEVYGPDRQAVILSEDGSQETVTLNQTIIDNETGKPVVLNDLSQGIYNVTCSSGPSFQNRAQETQAALLEMGQAYPEILQIASDILTKNTYAPGMDLVAERMREQLFNQGVIPISQMTDEEKQKAVKAAQQEQNQQDPNAMIGQAEMMKAQADIARAELEQQKIQIETQRIKLEYAELQRESTEGRAEHQIDMFKAETDRYSAQVKAQEAGANIRLKDVQAETTVARTVNDLNKPDSTQE